MPRLTLREALALALAHAPAVHQAREVTAARRGSLLLAAGAFDTVLAAAPAFEHETSAVPPQGLRNQELLRNISREVALSFRAVAEDLRRQLDQPGAIPLIHCPPGLVITISGQPVCLTNRERASWEILDLLTRRPGREGERRTLEEAARRRAEQLALVLDATALGSRNLLRTLGVRATLQDRTSLQLDLTAATPSRTGTLLTPLLSFSAARDNYRGKRLDPAFGGKGNPNTFTSLAGVGVEVPLGKGAGEAAAGAAERAARLNLRASLEREAHAAAAAALAAAEAYLQLAAAQERVQLYLAAEQRQAQLVGMGEALVAAGELAAAELLALRARHATTRAAVAEALQAVVEARIALARALGVRVKRLEEAPLAAEPLPALPPAEEVAFLRRQQAEEAAATRRADLQAARLLERSARELAQAARLDLRPSSTLAFQAWYQGLWEGRSPKDMRNVAVGWQRALWGGQRGPSARVLFTVAWPLGNTAARGRYLETRALYHAGGIPARNLERLIAAQVEDLATAMERARGEVARLEAAMAAYDQLIAAELERFRLGQAAAYDVLLTEEQRMGAALALVQARLELAIAMARLRFELGLLVGYRRGEDGVVVERPLPTAGLRWQPPAAGREATERG